MGVTVSVARMEDTPSLNVGNIADFGSHLQDRAFDIDAWTLIDEGGILMEISRETIDREVENFAAKAEVGDDHAEAVRQWVQQVFGDRVDTYLLLGS